MLDDPYDAELVAAVAARPLGEAPLARTVNGLRSAWAAVPEPAVEVVRRRARIVANTSTLRSAVARNNQQTEDAVTDQLVADGCARLEARAAASAVLAALTSALLWWAAEDQADLSSAIERALASSIPTSRRVSAMNGRCGSDGAIAVRAAGLTRAFGAIVAVDGLDLDVAAGQVHALVGLNGAGKSTLMRLLVGLLRPDAGSAELWGVPAWQAPAGGPGPDRLRRRRTQLRRAHRHRIPDVVGSPARMPGAGREATSRRPDRPARPGAVGVEADPDPVERQPAAARGGVGAGARPGPVDLGRADELRSIRRG